MSLFALKISILFVLGVYVLAAPPLDEQNQNVKATGVVNKQPTASSFIESPKDIKNSSDKDESGIDPEEDDDDDDDLEDVNENLKEQVYGPTKEVTSESIKSASTKEVTPKTSNTKMLIILPTNVTLSEPKLTDPNESEDTLIATGDLPENLNGQLHQMDPENPFRGILVHGVPVIFDDPKSPIHRVYYLPNV